ARNVYWLVAGIFAPVNTAMRYGASQLGIARPLEMLQQNLYQWFYTAFVHRFGAYLIDLNSGRLRVGAKRYRELLQEHAVPVHAEPAAAPAEKPRRVTI